MKNKKLYITLAIIVAIALIIIIVVKVKNKNNQINAEPILPTINISEVFELDDIKNTKYEIKKSNNEQIAKKYIVSEKYVLNSNVELNNRKGKMIYVRDANSKMNIYQTKYRIDDLDYTNGINKYLTEFLDNTSNLTGSEILQISDGAIWGEEKKPLYLEESIYKDKKLYTFQYEEKSENTDAQDNKKYDINFYMDGNYLMCELVEKYI